ncbi:MAG: winged helix-turn-helix domain-containing protein [Pontibacterium sp.]
MTTSKQQTAFYRKLYLAHLISQAPQNIAGLQTLTGMPRRTLQDTLKTLADIGIQCSFVQQSGERNNAGFYEIHSWGPIDPQWIKQNTAVLEATLGIEPQ